MVQAKGMVWAFICQYSVLHVNHDFFERETELISTNDVPFNFQLGANAILAVSLAVCKAGASVKKIPLYKVFYFLRVRTTVTSNLMSTFV